MLKVPQGTSTNPRLTGLTNQEAWKSLAYPLTSTVRVGYWSGIPSLVNLSLTLVVLGFQCMKP
jgi:hypothetical protein